MKFDNNLQPLVLVLFWLQIITILAKYIIILDNR